MPVSAFLPYGLPHENVFITWKKLWSDGHTPIRPRCYHLR
jgi:hypothetical protein